MTEALCLHQLHIVWYAKDKYNRSESFMNDLKVIVSLIAGCDVHYVLDRDVLFWVTSTCNKLLPIETMRKIYSTMFHNVYCSTGDTISIPQLITLMLMELRWIAVIDLPKDMPELLEVNFN